MTPLTGPLTDWPTDSTNYKEMLSHLKNLKLGEENSGGVSFPGSPFNVN